MRGKIPYRDFALQYGFIPSYLHAAFALVFGNTLAANRWFHVLASTSCLLLVYRALKRAIGPLRSLICTFAFMPVLLAPGGTIGTNINVEYIPIERLCFLVLILLWSPPDRRRLRRAIAIGATLGVWQEIKFGGAFFAGLSLLLVDLAWLYRHRELARCRNLYLRRALATGLTFLLVETIWVVLTFATTPSDLAMDAVFPLYVKRAYHAMSPDLKYPSWGGFAYFVTQQWLPLSCALVGAPFAYRIIQRKAQKTSILTPQSDAAIRSDELAWPLLIGVVFYSVACLGYLGHMYLWYQYCWTLLLAGAGGLFLLPRRGQALLLVSWVPAWLMMLKIIYVNPIDSSVSAMILPNSERVFLNAQELRELNPTIAAAHEATEHGHFVLGLFDWGGGGFQFFYNRDYALRNHMLAPFIFQPVDQLELENKLVLIDAVGPLRGRAPQQYLANIVGPRLSSRIMASFMVLRSPDGEPVALIRASQGADGAAPR